MFGKFLNTLADSLVAAAEAIKSKAARPISYLPPEPIGEIREAKHMGTTAHFWYYQHKGKAHRRYLSRDKEKAEQKREDLSGFLD
jgi:hypothetical protein